MSPNPYLERQAKKGVSSHGTRYEEIAATSLGARLHPASGALSGAKSDASTKEVRFEMKSSVYHTLTLHLKWLVKIATEAMGAGQVPAVVIAFVDTNGKPKMERNAEWVCIPKWKFDELMEKSHADIKL
jgi:hypothetical protein